MQKIIDNFEAEYRARIVYITIYGSKLFGTDNANSDTDYKGIFIPSREDVLLKKDIEHFNYNTNTKEKNDKEDVDVQLYSIYKWFNLLKKGETGALDLLFSCFREDTQLYRDEVFLNVIKENYQRFYNKNLHSFIGYCVGQSKMYNIKGQRYDELHRFVTRFQEIAIKNSEEKLEKYFGDIERIFQSHPFKYVRFVTASIARGNQGHKKGQYVELLGKRFAGSVRVGYFAARIQEMEQLFGHRTRKASGGVDYKALSHAVRVINEVEELLDDAFITFPLKNRAYIMEIKEGKISLEDVMHYIDGKLDIVQEKLEKTSISSTSDEAFMDRLILDTLSGKLWERRISGQPAASHGGF